MESKSLDHVPADASGYNTRFGLPLELVPDSSPIAPIGIGQPFTVHLYFKGKPLQNAKISFIPEGETLKEGLDSRYEVITNVNGRATFIPKEASAFSLSRTFLPKKTAQMQTARNTTRPNTRRRCACMCPPSARVAANNTNP